MTCIVAWKDKNGLYIGGDSAAIGGLSITVRKDEKVFVNGPFIMGFSDSFRMGQLLRFSLKVPRQAPRTSDYEFMSTIFIEAVRKCLNDGGFAKKENNEETGGNFVVGYKDNLYEIDDDFQVAIPVDNYIALGCGQEFAYGSLYNPYAVSNPLKKVRLALEAATKFSAGVRPPYRIIKKLKNGKVEHVEYKKSDEDKKKNIV
jgi:20S proteasome alpha/beta subunit